MNKLVGLLFVFLFISGSAQDFEMDDSVKLIYKPTNSSTPPHENFQFYNNSGDSLPIRWRVNQNLTFYPSQWTLALQDNETYHNPIIDSNDIVIPDSAGTMDKIIINVYHNGYAGYGELVIDLINLDSVQEVHQIKFEIDIYQPHNSIGEIEYDQINIYPNPAATYVNFGLQNENVQLISIFDISGKLVYQEFNTQFNSLITLDISNFPSGIYQSCLKTSQNSLIQGKFVIQK